VQEIQDVFTRLARRRTCHDGIMPKIFTGPKSVFLAGKKGLNQNIAMHYAAST
jgi:hypothetical protein